MPAHLKTIVDKSEQHMHKVLWADMTMKKCTAALHKARKQPSDLQDSRRAHQLAWIQHVNDATRVWTEQMNAYSEQQDQFNVKIAAVHEELKQAQQSIQSLGMQAFWQTNMDSRLISFHLISLYTIPLYAIFD